MRLLSSHELEHRRGTARRRARRRRILYGTVTPLFLVVLYFGISYASYMFKPTSEDFTERSAEWVRDDVPFGNWMIDTAEHDTASAPRKGGPGLTRLPRVGLGRAVLAEPAKRSSRSKRSRRRTYLPPGSCRCSLDRYPAKASGIAQVHLSITARRCW